MDRVGPGRVVDEADHGFPALLHQECWTGRDAVVADEGGFAQVGVDTLLEGLDGDLIVVNWLVGDRVGDGAGRMTGQYCGVLKRKHAPAG